MSARSLNKVQLIGNLTRDPELRYTPSGTAVCTFGMATNRSWTNDQGERQEDAEFHRVVAWGKLGEICSQLLYKGRKAFVEGRLQTRKWTGQDGQERETTEVVIEQMIALGAPKGRGNDDFDGYDEDFAEYEEKNGGQAAVVEEKTTQSNAGSQGASKKAQDDDDQKDQTEEVKEELDVDDIPF